MTSRMDELRRKALGLPDLKPKPHIVRMLGTENELLAELKKPMSARPTAAEIDARFEAMTEEHPGPETDKAKADRYYRESIERNPRLR